MVYDRWTLHIDKVTSDFRTEFSCLAPLELNWKDTDSAWSIAQNIDHLMLVNSSYFRLIRSLRIGEYKPPFLAKFKFLVERSGQQLIEAVQPDRIPKIKTLAMWEPPQLSADEKIFDKFEQHQNMLKQVVSGSYDLLDNGTVISFPANRLNVFKLSTAFDIILAHEKRHYEQAREVLELLRSKQKHRSNFATP